MGGISGTGPNDRILKADVDEALSAAKSAPAKAPVAQKVEEAPGALYTDR